MDLTPGTTLTVRTRGGRVCRMDVPAAGSQRLVHLRYAIAVGDVAVLAGNGDEVVAEMAAPGDGGEGEGDADAELDQLRAEYEERTGEKPHPRMKASTIRERLDALDEDDDLDGDE